MYSENYVRLILALAPFVVCLAFSLDKALWKGRFRYLAILSAAVFSGSVFWTPLRIWGAMPWLVLISWCALAEIRRFAMKPNWSTSHLACLASLLYLPVGGIWALFDQLGYQPLGFSGIIVLLTGVHFHYAGFALPRLTGLWLGDGNRGQGFQWAGWGVIFGVPLVAIGITTSQMDMPFWIETLAASLLAASAFAVSLGQVTWAVSHPMPRAARLLFGLGGLALAGGMVLATIYAWRNVYTVAWATIPAMYAFHGTMNSLGFCLPGFLGWKLLQRERSERAVRRD